MADISTKMSVSGLSQYKSAMNQAAQSVRTLDAQLKQNEAQYKASGDREKYMADKAKLLEDKLKAQKSAAKSAADALKQMKSQGVDPMSQAYQKMQQQLAQAETGVLETSAALNTLGQSEQEAAKGADQLTASVQGIGKKISLDQVINGVNKITDGLENAAKKAVEFGKAFFDEMMARAAEADDIMTKATMYDLTPERYQAMKKVAATWGETSVEAIMKARQRVQGRIGSMTDDLLAIGVDPYVNKKRILGTDQYTGDLKNWDDVFWEAGDALLHMEDAYERTQKAETIFGRKWEELLPMFKMGRAAYEELVDNEMTNSAEAIKSMAEVNDTINHLKEDFKILETEVLSGMAPHITKMGETLDSLLSRIMEWLKTEDGQAMLDKLGESVAGLFEDLANIDPEAVVNNFVTVFEKLVSSFEWISNNWSTVESGLKAIVGVWAAGKVTSGALTIVQMINGLRGLTGGGAGGAGEIALSLGGKLAFNGIEGTLGTKIGSAIATALTSTPMTVMIAAASIGALAHAIYTVVNEGDPLQKFLESSGMEGDKAKEVAEDMRKGYNPFDTEANARVTRGLKSFLQTGVWESEPVEIPAEVEAANTAEDIAAQVGPVTIPVNLRVNMGGGAFAGGGGGGGLQDYFRDSLFGSFRPGFANGLPFVPWDGYIAQLHRGERVLTAAQNRNYTANSNLYVENMNMSGGMDAQALAAAMSAQNRRISAGFGS